MVDHEPRVFEPNISSSYYCVQLYACPDEHKKSCTSPSRGSATLFPPTWLLARYHLTTPDRARV